MHRTSVRYPIVWALLVVGRSEYFCGGDSLVTLHALCVRFIDCPHGVAVGGSRDHIDAVCGQLTQRQKSVIQQTVVQCVDSRLRHLLLLLLLSFPLHTDTAAATEPAWRPVT